MKILISAYSCEPGQGSERGIGWNIVRQLAEHHQVWVLTRPDESRAAIEDELARNPATNLHFVYFTLPIWANGWRWGQGAIQLHYYLWQIQAYFVARQLHHTIGFDLVHHATFGKYSSPSFISLLPIPFVWGPVGGGESAPKAFWQDFSWRGKIYETLRSLARRLGEFDPFVHLTAQRSLLGLATTEETAQRLHKLGVKNVQIFSNVALSCEDIARLAEYTPSQSNVIRFVSIGRLLHWKGIHLALKAFALAQVEEAEFWIIGDGPERQRLETLVKQLKLIERVRFWGTLPREETLSKLAECHVLVHPSLHESGGWVCSEMMAAGHPVICLNLGGPGVQVTEETGIKIAANCPDHTVNDLSKAMISLAKDVEIRVHMGQAGQKLIKEVYSWEVKGKRLAQIFEEIVDRKEKIKKPLTL
ncbi:MAG: glycosyltransferase family 4 protein [Rhizonema sp. NSF051]|nr:glycosyltransferase family 4 protein [Rhizonema sp. NSF051]